MFDLLGSAGKMAEPPERYDFHFYGFGGPAGVNITLRRVTEPELRQRLIGRLANVLGSMVLTKRSQEG